MVRISEKKSELLLIILSLTHTPKPTQQLANQLKLDRSDNTPASNMLRSYPREKEVKFMADFYEAGTESHTALLE